MFDFCLLIVYFHNGQSWIFDFRFSIFDFRNGLIGRFWIFDLRSGLLSLGERFCIHGARTGELAGGDACAPG